MRALVLVGVLAGFLLQQPPGETDAILAQLSKIRLDKKQMYNVRDITIRRDVASISFNRGTIAFLEPVHGKVTGAVFIGNGEIVTIPPDAVEKQQMHQFTGSAILNEPFKAAFFRFTDDTYNEIIKAYEEHAKEDVSDDDAAEFLPWDKILTDRSGVLNYRLLADYLGTPRPMFFAELNGEKTGWFDVIYDPRFTEEVAVMKVRERETTYTIDVWASFNKRGETRDYDAAARENKLPLDILSYDIDATITPTTQLEATTTLHARANTSGDRVISLDLSRFLRVSAVTLGTGEAVPFYQHVGFSDDEIRRSTLNAVVLVLPKATTAGEAITLKFVYSGDVIEKKGTGIFFVGERGLWYPNLGTQDRSKFNLTFHFPALYSLVATGTKTREWDDGVVRHSTWQSEREFPVAGFNLGDFTILTDNNGPVPISVSVNNDVETVFREAAARRAMQKEMALRAAAALGRRGQPIGEPQPVQPDDNAFSTKALAENVLKGVRETLSFFIETFGPYPYSQLTVSQFPVNYSQGWPSLLYVSTLSFFTKEQRDKLGLTSESDFMVTEMVRAHEIAHQWFGNKVSWSTYHDQWISEAFANYAGAMFIEQKYNDQSRMREIMEEARRRLLARSPDGKTYESVGPIWLGQRLVTSNVPNGYGEIVYAKGTWIVHMLRMMMRSNGARPDEAFHKMVRDFLQEFDGANASTWDLKRVAERYMTKSMDIHGDRKLDWFFDQWIMGTGIPTYNLEYKIQPDGKGFVIQGTIRQSGVSDTFVMPVPVYADDRLLGTVVVGDDEGSFKFSVPAKPSKVTADPQLTILAEVKN
jgi:hypothetical protein